MAQVVNVCAPAAPRCMERIEQPFHPGISTRPSPACSGDICNLFACGGGNWRVTNGGTLDRSRWIEGWIITQLFTRGEVSCEEHPLGVRDGGWWADSFRGLESGNRSFKSGSKLWCLQWAIANNDALLTAKQYATEALNYLVAWGIASKLLIEPMYVTRSVMRLHIAVSGPGVSAAFAVEGQAIAKADWLWREYTPAGRA